MRGPPWRPTSPRRSDDHVWRGGGQWGQWGRGARALCRARRHAPVLALVYPAAGVWQFSGPLISFPFSVSAMQIKSSFEEQAGSVLQAAAVLAAGRWAAHCRGERVLSRQHCLPDPAAASECLRRRGLTRTAAPVHRRARRSPAEACRQPPLLLMPPATRGRPRVAMPHRCGIDKAERAPAGTVLLCRQVRQRPVCRPAPAARRFPAPEGLQWAMCQEGGGRGYFRQPLASRLGDPGGLWPHFCGHPPATPQKL